MVSPAFRVGPSGSGFNHLSHKNFYCREKHHIFIGILVPIVVVSIQMMLIYIRNNVENVCSNNVLRVLFRDSKH